MSETALKSRILKTESIDWQELNFIQQENFKEWMPSGDLKLQASLLKYQFIDPFKVWQFESKIYCLDGRHRFLDLKHLKDSGVDIPDQLPATFLDCVNLKEAAEIVLVYSSQYAKITNQGLFDFVSKFELELPIISDALNIADFDMIEFNDLFKADDHDEIEIKPLKDAFIIVPFSILDTRSGDWIQRKKEWLQMGFDSQETREDVDLIAKSGQSPAIYELRNKMRKSLGREPDWDEIIAYAEKKGKFIFSGASIFDPVLCELMYSWFCIEKGLILDPFAGGSVRGIVASTLGFNYTGIDLRDDQVQANLRQAKKLNAEAEWIVGDSNHVLDSIENQFDFVFSCPPYHDLEHYSDDPDDLSNMDYDQFLEIYRSIIKKSVSKLKDNSFACFVVGDIRDKNGYYRNFVSQTIDAFQDAGAILYNEMILINAIGSMAIRLRKQFNRGRKCGKIHQNVLVFYKGEVDVLKNKYPELYLENTLESKISQPNLNV